MRWVCSLMRQRDKQREERGSLCEFGENLNRGRRRKRRYWALIYKRKFTFNLIYLTTVIKLWLQYKKKKQKCCTIKLSFFFFRWNFLFPLAIILSKDGFLKKYIRILYVSWLCWTISILSFCYVTVRNYKWTYTEKISFTNWAIIFFK